jgi:AraC-like DNA-binding protein
MVERREIEMMPEKIDQVSTCYMGPQISPEQFVPEHIFIFLVKGKIEGYDGLQKHTLQTGQCCLIRKNRLARYDKHEEDEGGFEKVVVVFEESFLKNFQERHHIQAIKNVDNGAFMRIPDHSLIHPFILSLKPYYESTGRIREPYATVKREELLLILLEAQPSLTSILFDFGIPQKIDLEKFMNGHYKFNVSIERLAYMTGRSLSAFKRDFEKIFNDTPGRWLLQKRLQEAYFLIMKKKLKPSSFYLDLGFEDLSHFSFAFKKKFGMNASELLQNG